MIKIKKGLISLILCLVAVVAVSGCTSDTASTTTPSEDIYLQQQNTPSVIGDEATVNAWITTKSGSSYSNITLNVTGLTEDGAIVGSKKVYVDYLDNQYQSTGFSVEFPTTVDHVTIEVLNATLEED